MQKKEITYWNNKAWILKQKKIDKFIAEVNLTGLLVQMLPRVASIHSVNGTSVWAGSWGRKSHGHLSSFSLMIRPQTSTGIKWK